MKAVSTIALGFALALGGGAVALAPVAAKTKEAAAPKYNLSKDVQQNLAEAQKAVDAKDYATASAKVAAAEPLAKTADDRYVTAATKLNIAIATNNAPMQSQAIDGMVASGGAPATQLPTLLQNQGALAAQARDYNKAEAAFTQLAQLQPENGDVLVSLAEIKFQNKKIAEGTTILNQAIAAKKASGQPVPESWYQRSLAMAYDNHLADQSITAAETLVAAYPTASNWRDALTIYRTIVKVDDQTNLDVMRLMRAASAMKGESDYYEYASTALGKGLPGEAKAVIDEGVATHAIDSGKPIFADVRNLSGGKIAADRAGLPAADKQARAAATGKLASTTADAYLGYGQYAQAAALYRVALQKGGVDAPTVNTRLGIALAKSGDKPGAQQAFATVTGPRTTVAKFWTIWLGQSA